MSHEIHPSDRKADVGQPDANEARNAFDPELKANKQFTKKQKIYAGAIGLGLIGTGAGGAYLLSSPDKDNNEQNPNAQGPVVPGPGENKEPVVEPSTNPEPSPDSTDVMDKQPVVENENQIPAELQEKYQEIVAANKISVAEYPEPTDAYNAIIATINEALNYRISDQDIEQFGDYVGSDGLTGIAAYNKDGRLPAYQDALFAENASGPLQEFIQYHGEGAMIGYSQTIDSEHPYEKTLEPQGPGSYTKAPGGENFDIYYRGTVKLTNNAEQNSMDDSNENVIDREMNVGDEKLLDLYLEETIEGNWVIVRSDFQEPVL